MAVTKIWDVKGKLESPLNYVKNVEKTENPDFDKGQLQALGDVMSYAENEEKTEKHFYVSAINCNTTCARDQFITVKKQFGKEGGIIAYHGYQSFAPGETDPATAHQIGKELAKELWGDRFQVIVATHLNTKCLHNHFVINSVSFRDGKRYHDCRDTYALMRKTSDRICKEHQLSVVENPKREKDPSYLHMMDQAGMPTRYNLVRMAIDDAIAVSHNMREFEANLKSMGYTTQFNPKRKYWTVIPKDWKKPIRLARLGEEYTNEKIYERVMENYKKPRIENFQSKAFVGRQYKLGTRKGRIKKVGGLKGLYLRYCYELGYLPKYKQNPRRVHYLLRDDLLRLDKLTKEIRLLGDHNIGTTEELLIYKDYLSKYIGQMTTRRDGLRKEIRRNIPETEKEFCKSEIADISKRLKKARDELKLCDDIEVKSPEMEKKLELVEKEKEKEMVK